MEESALKPPSLLHEVTFPCISLFLLSIEYRRWIWRTLQRRKYDLVDSSSIWLRTDLYAYWPGRSDRERTKMHSLALLPMAKHSRHRLSSDDASSGREQKLQHELFTLLQIWYKPLLPKLASANPSFPRQHIYLLIMQPISTFYLPPP